MNTNIIIPELTINVIYPETLYGRFVGRAKINPGPKLLLPYQRKWVLDDSNYKLALKSRQIGWTWMTACSFVSRKSQKGERYDAWVTSRDEAQARLFIDDCKLFAKTMNIVANYLGTNLVDEHGNKAHVLEFANGRKIHSTSSSPNAQAGKRGDRIIDEFALHDDPRLLYSIAEPGIRWGGKLEIFSTPRGGDNYMNELIDEILHKGNPKGFSFHKVTLEDALSEGLLYRLQMKLPENDIRQQMDEADYFNYMKAKAPDAETFLQEHMCVPCDEQSAFLSYDLIGSCEYAAGEDWENGARDGRAVRQEELDNAELYIGVDVGRDRDLTVIWLIEKLGSVYYTREIEVMEKASFEAQEKCLYDLLALPQVKRCCIDQTGIGRQFAERAQNRFGKYKVEGVHFTPAVKEELAYPVRMAFEDRTIRIPNDRLLRADLRAIRKEHTSSGNVRFSADRGQNGHADRFWALALALHATKRKSAPLEITIGY
ncbi:MAG: phage terminase large subunit family protein [Limisphaerales bacterium]